MSGTALIWVAIALTLAVLSLRRPVWAVALYFQTFFAAPHLWWWGDEIPRLRYSLWSGCLLLIVVARPYLRDKLPWSAARTAAVLFVLNATFVHLLLAPNREISFDQYLEVVKFVLLFFLLDRAIRDRRDLTIVLVALAVGAGYIGYEATINHRGTFTGSRLEGIGAPAATTANGLASMMLLVTPLAGSLVLERKVWMKAVAAFTAPLILNVVVMCNSRGAFLGLIAGGVTLLGLSSGGLRKRVVRTLLVGSAVLYLLLGDPRILERFTTTFAGSDERDNSASSRIVFWTAGLRLLSDHPLGAGGGAFKFVYAPRYLREVGSDEEARSLHNGYLTTATDWGVQGLVLNVVFLFAPLLSCVRASRARAKAGLLNEGLLGLTLAAAAVGFFITCIFGSYLTNEWAFWIAALMLKYSEMGAAGQAATTQELAPVGHAGIAA